MTFYDSFERLTLVVNSGSPEAMHSRIVRSLHTPVRSARSLSLRANRGCVMGVRQAVNKCLGRLP